VVKDAYKKWHDDLGDSLYFFPCMLPNQRMSSQRGWFSCSSAIDVDHGAAIARAFRQNPGRLWCQRLVIAKEAKSKILRDLWRMNITGETIYCGLDGLGRAMSELVDLLNPCDNKYRFEYGLLEVSQRMETSDSKSPRRRSSTKKSIAGKHAAS
jgi:hypothetical protein